MKTITFTVKSVLLKKFCIFSCLRKCLPKKLILRKKDYTSNRVLSTDSKWKYNKYYAFH